MVQIFTKTKKKDILDSSSLLPQTNQFYGVRFNKAILEKNELGDRDRKSLVEIFNFTEDPLKRDILIRDVNFSQSIKLVHWVNSRRKSALSHDRNISSSQRVHQQRAWIQKISGEIYLQREDWFKYWNEMTSKKLNLSSKKQAVIIRKQLIYLLYVEMITKIVICENDPTLIAENILYAWKRFEEFEMISMFQGKKELGIKHHSKFQDSIWPYLEYWIKGTGNDNLNKIFIQADRVKQTIKEFFNFIIKAYSPIFQDFIKKFKNQQ